MVSGNHVILCDLESFREKLNLPDNGILQLTYSAVVIAPETVIEIDYKVIIDAVVIFTIAETELKVTPFSMVEGSE